jgi:hypothetical protein
MHERPRPRTGSRRAEQTTGTRSMVSRLRARPPLLSSSARGSGRSGSVVSRSVSRAACARRPSVVPLSAAPALRRTSLEALSAALATKKERLACPLGSLHDAIRTQGHSADRIQPRKTLRQHGYQWRGLAAAYPSPAVEGCGSRPSMESRDRRSRRFEPTGPLPQRGSRVRLAAHGPRSPPGGYGRISPHEQASGPKSSDTWTP